MPVRELVQVRYRLLEGEESATAAAILGESHDFGGELVLGFRDGCEVFVSWVGDPVQYSIGTREASHFRGDATLSEHDVSDSRMWRELLGCDVSFRFTAADNQILEISSTEDRVLVCAFERGHWWADALTVCRQEPAPYDVRA